MKLSAQSKIVTVGLTVAGIGIGLCACGPSNSTPSAQQQENAAQNRDSQNLETNQPPPIFNYSQERQTLIDAETIEANETATTTFFFDGYNQNPVMTCSSIGFPIPDSTELTNPDKVVYNYSGDDGVAGTAIGNQDPTGVYGGGASTGTLVVCVNGSGQKYLVRWEGNTDAVTSSAKWDNTTHQAIVLGAPTAKIHDKTGK